MKIVKVKSRLRVGVESFLLGFLIMAFAGYLGVTFLGIIIDHVIPHFISGLVLILLFYYIIEDLVTRVLTIRIKED